VNVDCYDEQLADKVANVRMLLADTVPVAILDAIEVFASPSSGHRHRATFAVHRPQGGADSNLELTMWDPVAHDHSIVRATDVPIYSVLISSAMEILRRLPIELDVELTMRREACWREENDGGRLEIGDRPTKWEKDVGITLGRGLRNVQFHSTLSGELLICLIYHDQRLRTIKRNDPWPLQNSDVEDWLRAARELRETLFDVVVDVGCQSVDIVGRWKRRQLLVERNFVTELLSLADGRTIKYFQPEGQFSNPNSACEIYCLNWLCQEVGHIRKTCAQKNCAS